MNILIVSYMLPDSPTGVSVHYLNLAKQLKGLGHNVTIINPTNTPKFVHYPLIILGKILSLFGQFGRQLSGESNYFIRIYTSILFSKNKYSYDIINAQETGSGLAAKLAVRNKIPVVVTCHYNGDPVTEKVNKLGLKGPVIKALQKWYNYQFANLTYFNGVSDYVLTKSSFLFPKNAVIQMIHNGVDFDKIEQIQFLEEFKTKYADKPIIMNIGHLEVRKSQRYLIRVAKVLRDNHINFLLVLIGKGEDESLLESMIEKESLKEHVLLLGHKSNVIPYLKCADLYIHTALNENCPLVLLEAIASQIPVVAFSVGGIPEILTDRQTLIDLNTDPTTTASLITNIISNSSKRKAIQLQQYAYGVEEFSINRMMSQYINFYNKAIHHHKSIVNVVGKPVFQQ